MTGIPTDYNGYANNPLTYYESEDFVKTIL